MAELRAIQQFFVAAMRRSGGESAIVAGL